MDNVQRDEIVGGLIGLVATRFMKVTQCYLLGKDRKAREFTLPWKLDEFSVSLLRFLGCLLF